MEVLVRQVSLNPEAKLAKIKPEKLEKHNDGQNRYRLHVREKASEPKKSSIRTELDCCFLILRESR